MKSSFLSIGALSFFILLSACSDANMKRDEQGNYVVNTTELGRDVKGFAGQTPLNVTIAKDGTIVKVEALQNSETPDFFRPVEEKMLLRFVGKDANSIASVDGETGATFSSRAVRTNVQLAVDYFLQHK